MLLSVPNLFAEVSGHRHRSRFARVMILPVIAFGAHVVPTVSFDPLDDFAHFHVITVAS
jgi:hypothetical protein